MTEYFFMYSKSLHKQLISIYKIYHKYQFSKIEEINWNIMQHPNKIIKKHLFKGVDKEWSHRMEALDVVWLWQCCQPFFLTFTMSEFRPYLQIAYSAKSDFIDDSRNVGLQGI